MKKLLLILLISCLMVSGCNIIQSPPDGMPEPTNNVKIYLVALEDEGKSGPRLANGDSLVEVERVLTNPDEPIKGALEELLSIKEQHYGQSGLYNALYQSNLTVDRIDIQNGEASVYLSGTLFLGGVMDTPRIKGQLEQTVLQFSNLTSVKIYVNEQPLDQFLSLMGDG